MFSKYSRIGLLVLLAFLVSAVGWARDGVVATTDCSKCKVTSDDINNHHGDQTVCPGVNAVVCNFQYNAPTKAECKANGTELRDCTVTTCTQNFTATNFAAGTCGTKTVDANGNTISSNCPTPTGGTMTITRDVPCCSGDPWDPTVFIFPRELPFGLQLPDGLTTLAGDRSPLESTLLNLPTQLLTDALAEGKLFAKAGDLSLTMVVSVGEPSAYRLVAQPVRLAVAQGNPTLRDSWVKDGRLFVELSIIAGQLGAFDRYAVDIGGLLVERSPGLIASEAPAGVAKPHAAASNSDELVLRAEIWAGDELIGKSVRRVGRP